MLFNFKVVAQIKTFFFSFSASCVAWHELQF